MSTFLLPLHKIARVTFGGNADLPLESLAVYATDDTFRVDPGDTDDERVLVPLTSGTGTLRAQADTDPTSGVSPVEAAWTVEVRPTKAKTIGMAVALQPGGAERGIADGGALFLPLNRTALARVIALGADGGPVALSSQSWGSANEAAFTVAPNGNEAVLTPLGLQAPADLTFAAVDESGASVGFTIEVSTAAAIADSIEATFALEDPK